ncbi:MAG: pyruvate dehydrogenase [Planctomycetota bacterium]|jgi:pyruvate dehydrogenase E1 component
MAPHNDYDLLAGITRRAFVQMVAMIHLANNRDNAVPGDPKAGGHPAACASCMEILAALHLVVRDPADYVCCKPHASPTDHALHHQLGLFRNADGAWATQKEMEAAMGRLRDFAEDGNPVFQSYHAEADPDSFHFLPSGSVGIPPVAAVYLALAHRYARSHGWEVPTPHFWCMMGDSEFREGSLMEVLPEVAERELHRVTWIVDYNRQNLDGTRIPNKRGLKGTDADRIQRTCEANGWHVIQVRHGSYRRQLFKRPGGKALQQVLEHGLTDYHFQMLLWKQDPAAIREAILAADGKCEKLLDSISDDEVLRCFGDLGGHDLKVLVDALEQSKKGDGPCVLVVHTAKGRGLSSFAAPGNHSALPPEDEVLALLAGEGLSLERPFEPFAQDSPEGKWLAARSAQLKTGIQEHDTMRDHNLQKVQEQLAAAGGLADSLDINLKLVPIAHTQWMWGQLAARLVRIGVFDELQRADKPTGRALTDSEARWETVADLVLTMAPDVGTSTNINPAMDEKIFGPDSETNWEKKLDLQQRLRPELAPTDEAWTRHIRFEIAEANCMNAAGSFGKMRDFLGIPYLPMMTVYDFFIKRALDQLYYNLYWNSSFILVGTPSGVTLAPEGAQHSWKSDIQIPNLITWEPAFAIELDWILCDAIRRHMEDDNEGRRGVLIRAVTRGIRQDLLINNLRKQMRFKRDLPAGAELGVSPADGGLPEAEVPSLSDAEILRALREDVLRGGYYLANYRGYRGYAPGENVVHLFVMGALAPEAVAASEKLLERGLYANVIVVSSPSLLLGLQGQADGFQHLRENLGITGDLHLGQQTPQGLGPLETADLAGRRIPVVSVHDGEEGLLDNIGSIVGVKQQSLAVRRFSKCGTPAQVYAYHGIDAGSIADACGRALAETALEEVRLTGAALQMIQQRQEHTATPWRELWPEQV